MKHDERSRAAIGALEAQRDKLVAWFKKAPEEREADVEKVLQTIDTQGVVAGRRMMAALGLPTIPDELCDPPNVLEVRHAQDHPERSGLSRSNASTTDPIRAAGHRSKTGRGGWLLPCRAYAHREPTWVRTVMVSLHF